MAYIGQSLREGTMQTYSHVATAGQVSFPCSYGVGSSSVSVFQNGVLLSGSDINLTSGNAAVLNVAAAASDEITIQVQDVFSVADTVSAANGGTFAGAVTASNGLTVDDDGATPLTVDRATSDGTIIDVQKNGTSVGSIGTNGGRLSIGSGDVNLNFNASANSMYPISDTSGTLSDGVIDIGASSARYKDLYLSGGAYIGGTGAANKLDDYEEGTWTPASSHGTISTGTAWYIKIGNMVHCGANIWNFSDRTSNNHVRFSVPFTSASGATATGSMIGRYIDTGTQSTWSPYLGASDSSIYWYRNPADANYTTLKHSGLNNSSADLHFHITYKTA